MTTSGFPDLKITKSEGAKVEKGSGNAWRLEIPAGGQGKYRLAQLDDYAHLPRKDFCWRAPLRVSLEARASANDIPGTWGFGLWNDPFTLSIFSGVERLRLPALPNTAWFFFASPPNHLSLREDLPARGNLAATFQSPRWPPPLLALGAPLLPFLFWRPAARRIHRLASRVVKQDAARMDIDATQWHTYEIDWRPSSVELRVDHAPALETRVSPCGPLGLVLWVDNQYAALPPKGGAAFGTLPNPQPAWIEIRGLFLDNPA